MPTCLVDAGPLISYFHEGDARHRAAVECFEHIPDRAVTTWPVIAEACHMLGKVSVAAQTKLLAYFERGIIEIATLDAADLKRVTELMTKYADRPMDLADATLVRVAEREVISTVATFDKKDFRVYRAAGVGALKVVP